MRKIRHEELIAALLGDVSASAATRRWLETEEGQRELQAYRDTLSALDHLCRSTAGLERPRTAYYTKMHAPIGNLFVAATDRGLVRISFKSTETAFLAELRKRLKLYLYPSAERMGGTVIQLQEYFTGMRRTFELPIDLGSLTPFQRRVLLAAAKVPMGQIASYGDIARRIGQPRASRAVGQALGRNPVPIVIPCHRIVRGGGDLGGYTGGLAIKKKLLEIEGALPRGPVSA